MRFSGFDFMRTKCFKSTDLFKGIMSDLDAHMLVQVSLTAYF